MSHSGPSNRHTVTVGRLYQAHAAACLGYARALVGSLGSFEEDIVHDVFVQVLRGADALSEERARPYLLAAIRNAAANLRRGQARERHRLEQVARSGPMFVPPPDEHQGADLEGLLAKLTDDQREVVYLKIWGGQTFAQIGELTGVPLQTAASRFCYGLANLRKLMESNR
jgi:RNA polymerase sigma-70 factor (ECF subfamily)